MLFCVQKYCLLLTCQPLKSIQLSTLLRADHSYNMISLSFRMTSYIEWWVVEWVRSELQVFPLEITGKWRHKWNEGPTSSTFFWRLKGMSVFLKWKEWLGIKKKRYIVNTVFPLRALWTSFYSKVVFHKHIAG